MGRKKKKLKLSPAMKMGMMLVLLEGKYLRDTRAFKRYSKVVGLGELPIEHRELSDGRKIPIKIFTDTLFALRRRGLIKGVTRYFRTMAGVELTKQGLHKIKQWPEYGEIIALKVLNDL